MINQKIIKISMVWQDIGKREGRLDAGVLKISYQVKELGNERHAD
jgi:hypothetical protein